MTRGKSDRRSEAGDALLVNYLLGNLTEEEQAAVEDRTFVDPDFLVAVEATEADLIDAYVHGDYSPTERRRFEQRFLASPERRKKVAFARDLARVAAETKAAEAALTTRVSRWRWLVAWVREGTPAFQLAAGLAVLICIAGISVLVFQNVAMRARLAALQTQERDLQARAGDLRRQLDDEQARTASLAARPAQQPANGAPAPPIASLVLLSGVSRAESDREQLLLNPSAQIANIEIQLEPRDDYPRFRAELRTSGGEEILIRGNLARRRTAAAYTVSLDVPASALATGRYELALKGVSDDQSVQDIGYYYFTVRTP